MILLDTHVALWVVEADRALGARTRRRLQREHTKGRIGLSAISFWEIAMLADHGRIELAVPMDTWRRKLLDQGLEELAVTGPVGIDAASLAGLHSDPADRIIVATARFYGAELLTADRGILAWRGRIRCLDART